MGGNARVSVDGASYEVDADLAGETVLLWWGLFDRDLYVECGERRFGAYTPVGGPIPVSMGCLPRLSRRWRRPHVAP